MIVDLRWATNLVPFRGCPDRFNPHGYRNPLDTIEAIRRAADVPGLRGVELHFPDMFEGLRLEEVRMALQETGLACVVITPTVSGGRFQTGALTNADPRIHREAVDRIRRAMDMSETLGAMRINLWLGQDGYDYPFQTDYGRMWAALIKGVSTCAEHNPQVQICVEYKPKEPRARLAVGNVGRLLHLLHEVNRPNVGGLLDVGHAFMAAENPSEAAMLLLQAGKLFHLHFNDTYGDWDWDLAAGSVHTLEFVELFFWLQEAGYAGWYSLDLFPQREDPIQACSHSIQTMEALADAATHLDHARLRALIQIGDGLGALSLLRALPMVRSTHEEVPH